MRAVVLGARIALLPGFGQRRRETREQTGGECHQETVELEQITRVGSDFHVTVVGRDGRGRRAGQDSAAEHAQKGYALAQRGETQAAEAELREAVRLSPNDPFALSVLGVVLSRPGKLEEANTYLERALQLHPDDPITRYNLALNEVRLGQAAPAKANLERILKQAPDHKAALDLLDRIQKTAPSGADLTSWHY